MSQAAEKQLLGFLRDIDERLDAEALKNKVPVYLLGGAAAVIGYGSRRGTADIDVCCGDPEVEKKMLEWAGKGSELEARHGIYLQRANTTLMLIEEPDWKSRGTPVLAGKLRNLEVFAASREDLILSKLSRFNDRDRQDIQFLLEDRKVDPEGLVRLYRSARGYFVGDLARLDATFNFVLQEHLQTAPISF